MIGLNRLAQTVAPLESQTEAQTNSQTVCQQFATAYAAAVAKAGEIRYTYQVAGFAVRLTFAGSALVARLTPALAHLATTDSPPDVTFYLWDGASTGSESPYPSPLTEIGLRGEIPAWSNPQVIAAIQTDVQAISLLDYSQNRGFYWIDTPDSLRAYERAAPLKLLWHWWLRQHGLLMIHAGVVGTNEGAVLLVGKTGAGKSTTTLACVNAGLQYVADDRCLLALEPTPQVYCLYNSAKLHLAQMEQFPNLLKAIDNRQEVAHEKALIYLQQIAPAQIAAQLPIRAILFAKLADSCQTTLSSVSRKLVLQELVNSTLVYQAGAGQTELQGMSELLRRLPCYQINLGSNLTGIAPVVRQAIQEEFD